jgi:hypothetical protein
MVEAAVLSDDHDYMLNWSSGGGMHFSGLSGLSGDRCRRSQVDKQREQACANRNVLSGLCQKI